MSLCLHSGAERVSLDDIIAATAPEPTETWYPIAYGDFVNATRESLTASGLQVKEEEYALMSEGDMEAAMMFALMTLTGGDDYALTVGLRASYNQRFANSLVGGSRVFVCDNLAFSGEVRINRKNTKWAYRDLIRMVMEAVGQLGSLWMTQEQRYEAYKHFQLTEAQAHDILIRSLDAKVMANAYIAKVLKEWREPQHEDFAPRTVWSLYNAYTEVFKGSNPVDLPNRTIRLEGLLDSIVNQHETMDALLGRAPSLTPAPVPGTTQLIGLEQPTLVTLDDIIAVSN